jgi:hypothetical protein
LLSVEEQRIRSCASENDGGLIGTALSRGMVCDGLFFSPFSVSWDAIRFPHRILQELRQLSGTGIMPVIHRPADRQDAGATGQDNDESFTV